MSHKSKLDPKAHRISVYKNTREMCNKNGSQYNVKSQSTLLTTQNLSQLDIKCKFNNMTVIVENEDVLVSAEQYIGKGSMVILNMTSCYNPGGGVERGSMAQEEEIFRRSNYLLSLPESFYPLKPRIFLASRP